MKKEFILEGLGCADCAAKIERSIKELEWVSYASVNFPTETLQIEITGDVPDDMEEHIKRIVRQYEPDVTVNEKNGRKRPAESRPERSRIILLILGIITFTAGMFSEFMLNLDDRITLVLFIISYVILGGKVVLRAAGNIIHGKIFDENFLMTVATLGAFAIGQYAEAVAVMLFFQIGEFFQDSAVRRSKRTISELMDIRPDFANLYKNGKITEVASEDVNVGDLIVIRPGEKVPLDGIVTGGMSTLDTSALTGESIPRRVSLSDTVLSGCINLNGVLTVEVTHTFKESTASKIIDLVENAAGKKAPTEKFITKFARYYTPAVVGLAALIIIIPPLLFGGIWSEWIDRGLIFLVISCPCALVISVPLTFFAGIGAASKRGILVKGGNYLEALNNVGTAVFDKTGTLTKGVFKVTSLQPANGFSEYELLEAAAKAEAFSNHPIAVSIMRGYGKSVDRDELTGYTEIAGKGVAVNADGKKIIAGSRKMMEESNIEFEVPVNTGTKVYVAADNVYAGCITISDEVREDSHDTILSLKRKGIRTVMLSGDDPQITGELASELEMDEVYGGLLPQHKVEKVEMLNRGKKGKLVFIGDGMNDAPVLAMADVGIAMGGLGSDAAIEAADVVLMTDEPSKVIDAITVARSTNRIVWQNIIFALGAKSAFMVLGAIGIATLWEAVFADVGVTILAILNSMRVMRKAG
ncbi:MAG: cadmium-translocating P-type ATPase [Methanomassiliicoccaceae archaeon]|nr:cadmium-translocating P-type ATPase [Methanomassiliicoccaceae archaeon]